MPETAIQADESVTLCDFARRNKKTGRDERLRVLASDYNGRVFVHVRAWYGVQPEGEGDDGWRPDGVRGCTFYEGELDQLALAIEEARRMAREQGRSTAPDPSPSRGSRGRR